MHNDEIKQALVTLVMAAYDNGIVTRQEVKEFDPEYEAALRQNDQWADASWGDWDRTPAPAYPVTFGYLDEDEPEVAFPEDEGTIIAIGYAGAFYHPDCAVEEAIAYGEASPAARDMTLADLYLQIQDRLLGGITVTTEITEVEGEDCGNCGAEFEAPPTEGGVITFGAGEVTLDLETGEFERTTTTEKPQKKGFFDRIFGS